MATVEIQVQAPGQNRPLLCRLRVARARWSREVNTDEAGKARLTGVAAGDYRLQVVQPPEFFVGPVAPVEFTVAADPEQVTLELTPLQAAIRLTGIAEGDNDAVARAVEVRVLREGLLVTATAVSQARPATVALPWAGSYRIVQTAAPRPYGLPAVPYEQTVQVDAAHPSAEVEFAQTKLTLNAQVFTEDQTADRSGARIALVDTAGADRDVVQTGNDGKAVFNPPAVGLYRLDLRASPPGFFAPFEPSQPAEVAAEPGATVTFVVVPSRRHPRPVGLWASIAIFVLLLALGGLLLGWRWPAPWASWPAAGATWVLAGFLGLLTALHRQRGFFQVLIGADNRTSTSRVAPAIWTLSLVWAISFLLMEAGADEERVRAAFPADRWDDYLILLGGPFAAFVIAKGITSWKVQNGQVQKTTNDGSPTPAQVFQNDHGATSLVDSQYLAFNLVALVYFWAVVLQRLTVELESGTTIETWLLPLIPGQLLALTGGAALTYAANKAIQSNKPVITAIEPSSVRPGEKVRIRGWNFRPDGSRPSDSVSVTIEGVGPCVVAQQTGNELLITVPPGATAGLHNLVVTSTANVSTEPRPFEIRADKPDLLGVREAAVRAGGPLHLLTRRTRSPLDPAGRTVFVTFGDQRTSGQLTVDANGAEVVRALAPRNLEGNTVQLSVQSPQGEASAAIVVPLAQRPALPSPGATRVRRLGGGQVELELVAEGFLGPDGQPGQASVLLDGGPLQIDHARLGEDARDHVLASGTAPRGPTATLQVKDWLGRGSDPVPVDVA